MSDLHGWITQQIERREEAARDATGGPWFAEHPEEAWGEQKDAHMIGGGKCLATLRYDRNGHLNADHIALNDPDAVLRRCAVDRQVLGRHTPHSMGGCRVCEAPHWGVQVCNCCYGQAWPCADITALATAYGWTDDTLNSKENEV